MGIRILSGTRINEGDGTTGAVLYCSTSGLAFGPLFTDDDEAEAFLDWCVPKYGDPRSMPPQEVADALVDWRQSKRRPE